jgi:hypothetical protein
MNKFTVVWVPAAERELMELWLAGSNRADVNHAADEIDRRLAIDPLDEGESRSEGRRVLILAPLVVTYRVRNADKIVQVTHVRHFKPRR